MKKYTPDVRLDSISPIPTRFERRNMLPDATKMAGFPWSRIPALPANRKPMGRRILAIYVVSTSIGFAAAWFGATTFDHVNLKIDSFRDRMDLVPYK